MTQTSSNQVHTLPPLIKYIASGLLLLASVALFIVLGFFKPQPETQENQQAIPSVAVYQAARFDQQLELDITGRVVPYREIPVPAQVGGIVEKKSRCLESGHLVEKDQLLAKIDQQDWDLELLRLQAELKSSRASVAELEAEIDGTQRDLKLTQQEVELLVAELARKEQIRSSISQSNLDATRRNLLAARKAYQSLQNAKRLNETRKTRLQSNIELVQRQIEVVELSIARTSIRSPAHGVVVSESIEEGGMVREGDVIARIEDISKVEIECNLRPDQLGWIIRNSSLIPQDSAAMYQIPPTDVVIYGQIGDFTATWTGVLNRVDGIGFDEKTKTIPCRIEVSEPLADTPYGKRPLVRNMYIQGKLLLDTLNSQIDRRFLMFPEVAIQPGGYIWIVRNQQLQRVNVQLVDTMTLPGKSGAAGLHASGFNASGQPGGQQESAKLRSTAAGISDSTGPSLAPTVPHAQRARPQADSSIQRQADETTFAIVVQTDRLQPGDSIVISPLSQPIVGGQVRVVNSKTIDPGPDSRHRQTQDPASEDAPDRESADVPVKLRSQSNNPS